MFKVNSVDFMVNLRNPCKVGSKDTCSTSIYPVSLEHDQHVKTVPLLMTWSTCFLLESNCKHNLPRYQKETQKKFVFALALKRH